MNQYVGRMLNEGLDLLQFAAICAKAMAVEDSRHYREVWPMHDREIEEGMARINEMVLTSAEERARLHQAAIAAQENRLRETWAAKVRVDAMREQVERWEPGDNVNIQGLKRIMREALDSGPCARSLALHQQSIDQLRAMTPQQYVEQLFQGEKQAIQHHKEAQEIEAERAALGRYFALGETDGDET